MHISRRTFVASAVAGFPAVTRASMATAWTPPPPEREWRVPVRGGRIYVRSNGDIAGGRAPVLLIHGGPGATHAYLIAALQLAGDRAVILYDQLDSGLSDHPGDPANWTLERYTSEIDAIRTTLGLSRIHVVGHSWGSAIALRYGAGRPAGLTSLTLASPFVSARSWAASLHTQLATMPPSMQNAIERHDAGEPIGDGEYHDAIATFTRRFVQRHPEPAYVTAYRRHIGVKENEVLSEAMFGPGDIAVTGTLRNYDGEPLLSHLQASTLLLCGQYDEMTPETVARLARRIPHRRLATIPDAGHLTSLDQPELFVAALRMHLRHTEL
jgi:proline-specific peptidase